MTRRLRSSKVISGSACGRTWGGIPPPLSKPGQSACQRLECLGPVRIPHREDHEVDPGLAERGRLRRGFLWRLLGRHSDLNRTSDLGGVSPYVLAMLLEYLALCAKHIGRRKGKVPMIGEACDDSKRALFAASPDHDRWTSLGPLRLTSRLGQLEIRPGEIGLFVPEQTPRDLDAFFEAIHAFLHRQEIDPVRRALGFVPARADSQLEPAAAHDIEARSHVREQRGMAIGSP